MDLMNSRKDKNLLYEEEVLPEVNRASSSSSEQADMHIKYLKRPSISQNSSKYLTSDQVLERISQPSGRFQLMILFLATIQFNLGGIVFYGIGFLEKDPTYFCEPNKICTREEACKSGIYTTSYQYYNIIQQYGLECKSDTQIGFIAASYFIGFLVGSIFFPRLSDIIGRKPIELTGIFLFMILTLGVALGTNLVWLYICMFLIGCRAPMNTQVVYIHLQEYVGQKYRNKYATGLLIVDGITSLWTPFYFIGVKNFLPLYYFAVVLAGLLFILTLLFFPESARYYISRGKFTNAKKLFYKVAIINKVDISAIRYGDQNNSVIKSYEDIKLKGEEQEEGEVTLDQEDELVPDMIEINKNSEENKGKTGFIDFLKGGWKVLFPLGIMAINWYVANFVSYGIMLAIKNIDVDIFYLGVAIGIAEVLSYLLSGLLSGYAGRKPSLISLYIITIVCAVVYQILYRSLSDEAIIILVLICKLGITAAFALVYLITSELFPTVYRGTTFGITNFIGRMGGIFAPLVDQTQKDYFMLIFAIAAGIALVLTLCLRQTRGKKLKDTLEEMDQRTPENLQ